MNLPPKSLQSYEIKPQKAQFSQIFCNFALDF